MRERITSKELAKLIGVSSATISPAFSMNARISEQTRARVLAIAQQHGYQPNAIARTLNNRRSSPVAVVVNAIDSQCEAQQWKYSYIGYRLVLLFQSFSAAAIIRIVGLFRQLSQPCYIEHSAQELLSQRIFGLVPGYEDLNDHNHLRRDPIHGLICGKSDPLVPHCT